MEISISMTMDALRRKIEGRLAEMRGPYPTSEISRIASGLDHEAFAGNLELYFDFVYSCSNGLKALHTGRKTREQLLEIRRRLSSSVFERHPEYEQYRMRITPESTPALFTRYTATEFNRLDLLDLLDEALSRNAEVHRGSSSGQPPEGRGKDSRG